MIVKYGNYFFPSPLPFVAVEDNPIIAEGNIDSVLKKITLIGSITGENLPTLASGKRDILSGLKSEYLGLTIGDQSFSCVKPVSLSFDESPLTTVLPYSIEFEVYEETTFSNYFRVKNPVNTWTFTEQQGRIVKASHQASAVGAKVDNEDPLVNAKTFVDNLFNGLENLSVFNSGTYPILSASTEEIDRQKGSYSRSQEFTFSTSSNLINTGAIISATTQLSYSQEGNLQASVNGSIVGPLNGDMVNTGMFSPSHATELAKNAAINSMSAYENDLYGYICNGPSSYNYEVNEAANSINFTFNFKDPTDETSTNIYNNQTVVVSATKDSNIFNVSVNGNITYRSDFDIFGGGNIDTNQRFVLIEDAFEKIDFAAVALDGLVTFLDGVENYDSKAYINPQPRESSVTKNPFIPSIDYDYTFTNAIDFSNGQLNNLSFTISDNLPIAITGVKESIAGFVAQKIMDRKLGELDVQASCKDGIDKLPTLKSITTGLFKDKICERITTSNYTSGESLLNYSFTSLY